MFVRYEPCVNMAIIDLFTVLDLFLPPISPVSLFHLLFHVSIPFAPSSVYPTFFSSVFFLSPSVIFICYMNFSHT